MNMMKLLLIGANGYTGARLYHDLRDLYDVTGTYAHAQLSTALVRLDITKPKYVQELVGSIRPEVIIHTANNASPSWCEAHPEEARILNEASTQTVVDAANAIGARLIYISSSTAVEPRDVYSRTKRAAEEITKQATAGWLVIRPALIMGYSPNTTNDRPFNRILKNLDDKTPAIYDTSWKVQSTWLGHLSEVIKLALDRNIRDQIIPVAVPELKSKYDIAQDILRPFGVRVQPIDDGKQPAPYMDLSPLAALGLPAYSYADLIDKTVAEIRHRQDFRL